MKTKLFILIALTLSIISCKKSEESTTIAPINELPTLSGESNMTFDESVEKWNSLKVANNNSYYYQTEFTSSWDEIGSITQIKVLNGVVTEKMYQSFTYDNQTKSKTIIENLIENQSNLGNSPYGIRPITIDEIYTDCRENYLTVDASTNTKILEISTEGIIIRCGYIPKYCADDCYRGASITGFQWIK